MGQVFHLGEVGFQTSGSLVAMAVAVPGVLSGAFQARDGALQTGDRLIVFGRRFAGGVAAQEPDFLPVFSAGSIGRGRKGVNDLLTLAGGQADQGGYLMADLVEQVWRNRHPGIGDRSGLRIDTANMAGQDFPRNRKAFG